jgi:integrase
VSRAIVKEYGSRGSRRCLVIREDSGRYLVERYIGGHPKRKRFADKTSAIRWAGRWYDSGNKSAHDFTLRQLIDLWTETEGEKKGWRVATRINYQNHRKRIEECIGPEAKANTIGLPDLDELWRKLTRAGMAGNQIKQKVQMLQRIFAWGLAREYVSHNKLATWDIPEVKRLEPGEYAPADTDKILAQWDKEDGWAWRPWALTMIQQSHGIRITSLLNVRWADVDLATGRLGVRKETDKTNEDWGRPLTWDAWSALLTARWHRERLGKGSEFVFYGKGGKPYTYGAYHAALLKAEKAAGVKHEKYRAAHGFRRTAVGNVRRATGDHALALMWVNHKNLRDASAYVKGREDEFAQIADRTATVPEAPRGK